MTVIVNIIPLSQSTALSLQTVGHRAFLGREPADLVFRKMMALVAGRK